MSDRATGKSQVYWIVWLLITAGVAIFCGANTHLVYVAMTSQPSCVAHLKEPLHGSGIYRAAQSDC